MTQESAPGGQTRPVRPAAAPTSPPPNEGRPWDGINRFEIQIVATLDVVPAEPTADEGPQ